MLRNAMKTLIIAAALIFQPYAHAEDIDLFVGATPGEAPKPNVLILLDNTGNWSAPFQNEIDALVAAFSGLPEDKVRVGLMMFTETGGGNSNVDGGYVRAAIRTMTPDNKTKYAGLIDSFDSIQDRSNSGKLGKTMAEAYFYFAGKAPYAGHNKLKTDYTGNVQSGTALAASRAIWALPGNALQSFSGSPSNKYISPVISGDACAKNYIIYISNGAAQDSNADSVAAANLLNAAGGSTTTIPISPSGSMGNMGDEWARFMKSSNEEITTYTIDVNKVTTGQGPGWTALLKSMANVSDGKYFDVTSTGTQILDTLNLIFSEIQSVNSVFASVSLPISVNTQGTYLNQVFIGMFRPDGIALPRWPGNLKQYRLGFAAGELKLLDANNAAAINSSTGFIAECARSYWTVPDNYWLNLGRPNCLTASAASNAPDGNLVEKGGQAQMLRSMTPSNRNIKTCSSSACTGVVNFASGYSDNRISTDTTERNTLINWLRGHNLAAELSKPTTEMRSSVHGDVVHSRPVAINYGDDTNRQVVVFYGGNDGILRAVNGNREGGATIGSASPGQELWSFVVPEFFDKIKRLYRDDPPISFPGQIEREPPLTPAQPKDYGVDGSVTAYQYQNDAWVFATLRRGGRALYALDVSTPSSPLIKWRIGCPNAGDDIGCTSGFSDMGQSWSALRPIKASGYNDGLTPLLMVGGGYDTCHDNTDDQNTGSCGSKGRRIYLIDAGNGSLVKAFNTDSSVVGDIAIVPDAESGLIKYAYAADLGGNVYRISGATANSEIGTTPPANWTMTKIAAFGGAGVDNRKFMFSPDVLDEGGGNYVLLLGSGDREKPLTSYTTATMVNNRFYMIKDKPGDSSWLASENFNCGADMICHASLVAITSNDTPTDTELKQKKGWYLALKSQEQVVTTAITVFGTVTFSTHQPTPPEAGSCGSNLGTARVYNINYRNATSRNGTLTREQVIVGGGLPPSPVAGMVTLDDGRTIPFIIGAKPTSALEGAEPPPPSDVFRPKGRVYWNIKK